MFYTEWLLACRSRIGYERRPDNQVFRVLPVEAIIGLPVVPIGVELATQERFHTACASTRRILYAAAFDTREGRGPVTEAGGGISTRGP